MCVCTHVHEHAYVHLCIAHACCHLMWKMGHHANCCYCYDFYYWRMRVHVEGFYVIICRVTRLTFLPPSWSRDVENTASMFWTDWQTRLSSPLASDGESMACAHKLAIIRDPVILILIGRVKRGIEFEHLVYSFRFLNGCIREHMLHFSV